MTENQDVMESPDEMKKSILKRISDDIDKMAKEELTNYYQRIQKESYTYTISGLVRDSDNSKISGRVNHIAGCTFVRFYPDLNQSGTSYEKSCEEYNGTADFYFDEGADQDDDTYYRIVAVQGTRTVVLQRRWSDTEKVDDVPDNHEECSMPVPVPDTTLQISDI